MKKLLADTRADIGGAAGMIGVVIATLVAIIIGVLIWYKLNSGIWTAAIGTAFATSQNSMRSAFNSTNASANTIWTLFPIVCIVLIAGIILAIVTNFGRSQA